MHLGAHLLHYPQMHCGELDGGLCVLSVGRACRRSAANGKCWHGSAAQPQLFRIRDEGRNTNSSSSPSHRTAVVMERPPHSVCSAPAAPAPPNVRLSLQGWDPRCYFTASCPPLCSLPKEAQGSPEVGAYFSSCSTQGDVSLCDPSSFEACL